MSHQLRARHLWAELYGDDGSELLEALITRAGGVELPPLPDRWWQSAVVYSLYVEQFGEGGGFDGVIDHLDHLEMLGITCLWLLPVLDSPMRDAGFDIAGFDRVRDELGGNPGFQRLLSAAHARGIRVLFDVAVNHISDEHPWFRDALAGGSHREWFHWSATGTEYPEARLLFKGMVDSNWEPTEAGDFYFHRFYPFQPDLNYRNPEVAAAMLHALLSWIERGVDGFRVDAIPFLWKEEGTTCENLPEIHTILKLFRAIVELARPNTLLLAEACQAPGDVVQFFGDGDECQAAYHFPLMPRLWLAAAEGTSEPILRTLAEEVTPPIPENTAWFVFLRVHDELTLEFISDDEQERLRRAYLRDPAWSFRSGEGISARLATLLDHDPTRILSLYSVLLTIGGTPVIYYGDEFALENDVAHHAAETARTGWDDSRFLVRGPIDWGAVGSALGDEGSSVSVVSDGLQRMLSIRADRPALWGTERTFLDTDQRLLAYRRGSGAEAVVVVTNLSPDTVPCELGGTDVLGGGQGSMQPYETRWIST